ncbi:MAG: adaptor protein MecA, partial [Eubacteriales bacterium]|nr:adaptor protein MecA [Eubacteriales bacterium]
MRIDKINENQFRCYLSREEMQQRKIHLKELAYGTDKAKELFHEMMQEAYARYGFTADNMPVMIEAVPLQDDSLVLTVTKVENPEELDTRFSSFAPFVKSGDAGEVPHSSPLEQLLESIRRNLIDDSGKKNSSGGTKEKDGVPAADNPDAGTIAGVRNADNRDTGDRDIINRNTADRGAGNRNAGNRDTEKQNAGSRDAENRGTEKRDAGNRNAGADKPAEVRTVDRLPAGGLQLYTFPSLGKAVDAAALASPGFRGKSSLYRDPAASMYYLFLTPEPGTSAADYNGVLTILSEFGTARAITPAREQHLREH